MPERVYLPRGMMGRLECPVDANPPVTMTVWTKDTKIIDLRKVRNVRMVGSARTLVLDPVTTLDEGEYTCTPYSTLGAGQQSTTVHVLVRGTVLYAAVIDILQP